MKIMYADNLQIVAKPAYSIGGREKSTVFMPDKIHLHNCGQLSSALLSVTYNL